MKKLEGKTALVTGGTSGIGREAAVALARAGAKVTVTGRREAEGAETVRLITEAGGEGHYVKTDVRHEADIEKAVEETVARFGGLDIALNNAGVETAGPLTEAEEDTYRTVFDINVWGVLASMKHEVPAMLKGGGGTIINVSSVAGQIDTDMADRFAGKEGEQREYIAGLHPIGRSGKPREVADAVVWLASDESSFVTGHSLNVDGGWTAQ